MNETKPNVIKFFQNEIKDNNYKGYSIGDIELSCDFCCDTYGCKKKEQYRKEGIEKFLWEIYNNIASKNLSELDVNQIIFDEEFEANKDQKIFDIAVEILTI